MRTEAHISATPNRLPLTISKGSLACLAVALAILTSTIVFSEPAAADLLMMGVIVAVPLLGASRFGRVAVANLCIWSAIVGLSLLAATFSVTLDTAAKHLFVTLYLVLGSFVLAGFVAKDPEPRIKLILVCYVIAGLIATFAGIAGYFGLIPGAYDLFTNFGRARGTFKDPNVYGAAVAPAIVACAWSMLRDAPARAAKAGLIALPLVIGLFLSFSRGAWISLLISLVILAGFAIATTRRSTDVARFGRFATLGIGAVIVALFAVTQIEQVRSLLEVRASLDQSYDAGPDGRFGGQAKARRLIAENPLGIGTHTFRVVHHTEEPHNVYLSMFLNAGWLGGFLYIVTVAATLAVGFRGSLERTRLQGPMLILTASFAGLAIEGFVIDSDHWRNFFILMGCIWGLADAARPEADTTRRQDDPVSA